MTRGSAAAREAAGKLTVQTDRLRAALERARAAAGDPPDDTPADQGTAITDLVAALDSVRGSLLQFADAIDEHGPPLRSRLEDRQAGASPGVVRAVDRDIRAHTDALTEADARCRAALETASRTVPTPAAVAEAGGWVAAVLSAAGRDRLTQLGVLEPASTRARHRAALSTPDRADLACLPAPRLRAVLARHPDLADRLAADRLAADRLAVDRPPGPSDLSPEPAAHLWPAVIGPLDGADPRLRAAANRRLIRAELVRVRLAEASFARPARASRRTLPGQRFARPPPDRDVSELRVRIRLYESLLADRVEPSPQVVCAGGPFGPSVAQRRRVLLFDPAGRGRLAELCGRWPDEAATVAVFVPGTGTAARGFHQPAQVAADLAAVVPESAVVAWMGADFPQALAGHALRAGFAVQTAPRLVRFVAGLGVPDGLPITVIGHSYGGCVVGAAERLGLRADRVVLVASPGAGPGVQSVTDYAERDGDGRVRLVDRYELTAPADPVRWVRRRRGGLPWSLFGRGADLGVDPSRLEGVSVLEAGVWERDVGVPGQPGWHRAGEPVRGAAGHGGVVHPATTAFGELARVVAGQARSHGPGPVGQPH